MQHFKQDLSKIAFNVIGIGYRLNLTRCSFALVLFWYYFCMKAISFYERY